jgi:hypothetical protein
LLVAAPESIAGTRVEDPNKPVDPADLAAVEAYRLRLSQIVRAPLPADPETNVLSPRAIPLSPEAAAMWWAFYNSIEVRLGPKGDLNGVKGFVGKLPEQAARLAAVIAVFDLGARIQEIGAEHLARGIALAQFYLSEAQRLFGQAAPRVEIEHAQLLSDWLNSEWEENLVSLTAVSQRGPGAVRQGAEYIARLFEILSNHDHLVPLADGGMVSGRKVRKAWRVVRRG